VHASHRFAHAMARLVTEVDGALGHPARFDLVDVGAGSGELLAEILAATRLDGRLRPIAVEVAPRPAGLSPAIEWRDGLPDSVTGLVIANEWLDNVPLDIVELTGEGAQLVLVDPATGAELPGPPPSPEDAEWLERWWLHGGLGLAIDYAHERDRRPAYGTLTGYRDGRCVSPIPDGSCDITAHVALDACAEAGENAGASGTLLTTQRAALRALGLRGARPPLELARTDPRGYLHKLRAAGEDAELIDREGLGGFGWLVQTVGIEVPPVLTHADLDLAARGHG
jgi:SAM-dependent MidA family methyltransferase